MPDLIISFNISTDREAGPRNEDKASLVEDILLNTNRLKLHLQALQRKRSHVLQYLHANFLSRLQYRTNKNLN